MTGAHIHAISTAVPENDVHLPFLAFARALLADDARKRLLFDRMVEKSGIAHRFSALKPGGAMPALDEDGFYVRHAFPATAARMNRYERDALPLAVKAVAPLLAPPSGARPQRHGDQQVDPARITHLLLTSCTGFAAPGVDLQLMAHFGLKPTIERSLIGFMGCHAAINGLKLARHIVRSEPDALVLMVNLELCSLHLNETDKLDEILSFLLFGDGCAASLIGADPRGVEIESFHAALLPESADLIRWNVRDRGFDMVLSGKVPAAVRAGLAAARGEILDNRRTEEIRHWAVHPGGRTVLDAVEAAFALPPSALSASRGVLSDFGNMSSPTVMFVLDRLMKAAEPARQQGRGVAMAFGPGLAAETMRFQFAA